MVAERDRLRALDVRVAGHRVGRVAARRGRRAPAMRSRSASVAISHASRTTMRFSSATWSLRERAVCSRPAASPIFSRSRTSTCVWMSSSSGRQVDAAGAEIFAARGRGRATIASRVGLRDDALLAEHAGVGDRAGDVVLPEVAVHPGGVVGGEVFHAAFEAAAPGALFSAFAGLPAAPASRSKFARLRRT